MYLCLFLSVKDNWIKLLWLSPVIRDVNSGGEGDTIPNILHDTYFYLETLSIEPI